MINFRVGSGGTTDNANETYCAKDQYPVTRTPTGQSESFTFGWVVAGNASSVDRSGSPAEVFGINYATNNAGGTPVSFQIDLPATGQYKIALTMGDFGATNKQYWAIYDNTSLISDHTVGLTTTADHYSDSTGVIYSTFATWNSSNTPVTLTFASN